MDDYGVQSGFRIAYGKRALPKPKALAKFGERWAPYRTTASWYLWRAVDLDREARGKAPELIARRGTVLGDGAMGTMLHRAGLTDGAPERWNVERPDVVSSIHRAYVEAGSDFISTNTFGGTRNRLALDGLEARLAELNEAGARLAREAAGERLVAGSMGPTGELMEPLGLLTPDGARESFAEQARALKAGGVDFVLIETMSALEEVEAAVAGAREAGLPAVVTMSFDTHFRTMMGVKPVNGARGDRGPRRARDRRQLRQRPRGDRARPDGDVAGAA